MKIASSPTPSRTQKGRAADARRDEPDASDNFAALLGLPTAISDAPAPRLDLSSITPSGDPRSPTDGAPGAHPASPTTSIAREPGLEARGLLPGSAWPGGAGAETTPGLHGSLPGSRGIPPSMIDEASDDAASLEEDPSPIVDKIEVEASPEADVAPTGDTPPTRREGTGDGDEPSERFNDADAVDTAEPVDAKPTARTTTAQSPTAAASLAEPTSPTRAEKPAPTAPTAPEPPPEMPDLAPTPADDRAVRVQLDADLAVEIAPSQGRYDVTVEGGPTAVEALTEIGPELEHHLARGGWSLGTFQSRRDRHQPAKPHHRGPAATSPTDDAPRPRARRGHLLDIIA